jgi:FAD/FMN-containing dehydrogenase
MVASLACSSRASQLLAALTAQLGDAAVLAGDSVPVRNESGWSTLPPVRPLAVVRPSEPRGVAATLRLASEFDVAVTPQGGMTGLAGGARPIAGALALSLERLVGIEEIDTAASTITVRAGTTSKLCRQPLGPRASPSRSISAAGARAPSEGTSRPMPGAIASSAMGWRVI